MREYAKKKVNYVVPTSTYKIYASGEHCLDAKPGDLIVVRHKGNLPFIIRLGQKIYYWRKRLLGHKEYEQVFTEFNHAAVVVAGGKDAAIVEMEARGGHKTVLSSYQAEDYAVIKLDSAAIQKQGSADFANYCLNIDYGYLSIAAIVLNVLIGWDISLSNRSLICSAATSLSARCQGLIPDGPDTTVLPADICRYFGVRLTLKEIADDL